MSTPQQSLFSPKADTRKISFSPSNASRATAFAMKHGVQTQVGVIEMQMELSDLRKRVKILDSNTGRNDLINKLKEREEENQRAEQQLRTLNDKFHQVHKGLVQIDQERETLRNAKDQLEKEKKEIQRQLDIREKEVLLLAKRCSSQEQKMKESTRLRASNNELATEMEGLRTSLTLRDEEISQIDSLRRELKECQESRQELLDLLAKVKKDHDNVVETLNSCFQNIQRMQESKTEVEEERKREMQRFHMEMEKQRLAHLDAINELRAEVQLRQDRIVQMEEILKDSMSVCTTLRKEKAEWNTNQQLELAKLKEEHAAERSALNCENDRLVQKIHDEYDTVLSDLRTKLEEKDGVVSSLEDEVSKCMQKMMTLSTEMQHMCDEKTRETVVQAEAIETLERERDELKELVCARDTEIAKLSESITALESEKNSMSSQLVELRDRIKELEEENAFIMDLENQLHDVNTTMVEVTEQKNLESEEYGMTVALLQQELDDERSMWASMEQGLQERISELEQKNQSAKEASDRALSEARQVLQTIEESSSTTEEALHVSLKEVSKERTERAALEKELICLKSAIAESQTLSANEKKRIEVLETELSSARELAERATLSSEQRVSELKTDLYNARKLHETEVASNMRAMEFKELALASLRTELRDVREASKLEIASLKEQLKGEQDEASTLRSQLSEARITVGAEATASQRILSEKDSTITLLTTEIGSLKAAASVQEKSLREAESRHEERVVQIMEDLEASRLALESEKTQHARESKFKDDALESARAELEELRTTSDSERAELKQQLLDYTARVSSLESELVTVRSKAKDDGNESRHLLASKDNELTLLKAEFDELRRGAERRKQESSEALESKVQELEAIQTQLARSRQEYTNAQKLLSGKDEEILSLKAELEEASSAWTQNEAAHCQELEAVNNASESLKQQLRDAREAASELEVSHKALLLERDSVIARLETELSETREALETHSIESSDALSRCEKTLALTRAELEQARSEADTASALASETVSEKDAVIDSLRSNLDEVRKELSNEKRSSNISLQAKDESVVSLHSQLTQVQLQSEREKTALKKEVSEKEVAIELLRTELDDLCRARESDAALHEKRIEAKDEALEALKSDLGDIHSRSETEAKSLRQQVARLTIEVQKASTNLAIREDEIRDLKLIDLKEAEETIASLESQLENLKESSNRREAEASGSNAALQSRLVELKTMNDHLQQKIKDMSQQHNKTLVTLSDEMAALKQAKEDTETHARELSEKLRERHSTITVMTRKTTLLEQRERTLQSQLDSAGEEVRRAKEGKEKALTALDFEINRRRADREDDDISLQRQSASFQIELEDVKTKLEAQKERTAEVERVLQERTKLLGDMVTNNKETEDEKEQALAHITDLQEAVDRLEEESLSAKEELAQVQELQRKREDQLLATIHDERHAREVAEADLEALQSRLRSVRRESKDVNELEKENLVLKDKIRRQEDFLKRKLQKDKVLRDRNSRNVMATPKTSRKAKPTSRTTMSTPRRIPSPSKRRSVPASVGVGTTASTTMSVLSESSFPDEWDASSFRS